jgi:hypothetical protein
MKLILIIAFSLISLQSIACRCSPESLVDSYNRSTFIAMVKILKVTPHNSDQDYHDLDIEIIALYKGKPVTKILANTFQRSSCSFNVTENSTWLIFANSNQNETPTFSYCSASYQLDKSYNETTYPGLREARNKHDKMMMETLEFLKTKPNQKINSSGLMLNPSQKCNLVIEGYQEQNTNVAIFELTINAKLSIKRVHVFQTFSNRKMAMAVYNCLKKSKVLPSLLKPLNKTEKLLVFYYLWPTNYNTKSVATQNLD